MKERPTPRVWAVVVGYVRCGRSWRVSAGVPGPVMPDERIPKRDDLRLPELVTTSFPATDKKDDSRYPWFVEKIGLRCCEVDALSPVTIRDRVEAAITSMIRDKDAWHRYEQAERAELDSLGHVLGEWARLKES